MLQDCSTSLVGVHGRANFTSFYGTNWRFLLSPPHLTAQVGCDSFMLPADGCGHGSSTCCDGVRALNATACVSRSLRYFLQRWMNVINEQVDVEYRVMWISHTWACPHTSPKHHNLFCLMHGNQTSLPALILRVHHPFLQKAVKPSTASQSKTCLTLLPEDQTESAWEDELYTAGINENIKKTDQYLFRVIICTSSCTAHRKAKERTVPWLGHENSMNFQRFWYSLWKPDHVGHIVWGAYTSLLRHIWLC